MMTCLLRIIQAKDNEKSTVLSLPTGKMARILGLKFDKSDTLIVYIFKLSSSSDMKLGIGH